jgi:hypothetical protein
MDAATRDALLASPGGQIALERYQAKTSSVIQAIQNELPNLKDEFGQVDPKKIIDFAASHPDMDVAIAGEVKRAISVIDETVNKNALQVQSFKQNVAEFNQRVIEKKWEQVDATIGSSGFIAASRAVSGEKDGKPTLPPAASRLIDGGLTPSEVILHSAATQYANPIADSKYADTQVMNIGRFLIGDNADLEGIDGSTIAEVDATEKQSIIAEALQREYDAARTGGGDIRESMATNIARSLVTDDMSEQEKMYWIRESWNQADAYAKERVAGDVNRVRTEQTSRVAAQIDNEAASIARAAIQGRGVAFNEVFNSDAWKQVNGAKGDASAQAMVLGGAFADKLEANVQGLFARANPADIADLQEKYDMYLGTLGTPNESALAQQDEDFADIVRARDAYVDAGLTMAGVRYTEDQVQRNEVVLELMKLPEQVRANYTVMEFGGKAYGVPVDLFEKPMTEAFRLFGERAALAGAMTLKDRLTEWGDNTYVRELMDGLSENGVIRGGAGEIQRLASIVKPPSDATVAFYETNPALKRVVVESYVRFPEQDRRRVILDQALADQAAGTSADSPYSFDEYSAGIAPVLEAADIKDAAEKLNDYFDSENALKYLQDGGVVEALYNSKEGGNRGKAVAMAYVMLKEERERDLAAIAMGGKSISGENIQGLKQRLGEFYLNNPMIDNPTINSHQPMIAALNDFKTRVESAPFNELMSMRDELNNLGLSGGIGTIRSELKAYEDALSKYNKQFGVDANGVPKIGPSVANAYTYGSDEIPGRGYQRMDVVAKRARELVDLYTSIESEINQRVPNAVTVLTPAMRGGSPQ